MATSICVCCNKATTWQFDICAECEARYKNADGTYPEWLTLLTNESQLERRRLERGLTELSIDDAEVCAAAEAYAYTEFLGMIANPGYISRASVDARREIDVPDEPSNMCWRRKVAGTCDGCDMEWFCGAPCLLDDVHPSQPFPVTMAG